MTQAEQLGAAAAVALIGVSALVLHHGASAPTDAQAERELTKLDSRPTLQVLRDRCARDAGAGAAVHARVCAALVELGANPSDALAGAAHLMALANEEHAENPDELREVQTLRVELLLQAHHTREAAHEATHWAEQSMQHPSLGSVRLWIAAAHANRAIGDDEAASADARHALDVARELP